LIFNGFDDRGAFLGELWFSLKGPPLDREALASNGIRVVQSKRRLERWFANIYSVPKSLESGGQLVDIYVSSLGPAYSETFYDVKFFTITDSDGHDDDPLSFLRTKMFRGNFPDNLAELFHLLRLAGSFDLRVVGQYLAHRKLLGSALDAIAPWLRQPPLPALEPPREATWNVPGYRILTSVRIRESSYEDAVTIKACGALRSTLSLASAAEIDVNLWREVTEAITSGRLDPVFLDTRRDP